MKTADRNGTRAGRPHRRLARVGLAALMAGGMTAGALGALAGTAGAATSGTPITLAMISIASANAAEPANDPLSGATQNVQQLGTVEVIGITPEQGATLPENLVPYNVQSATSSDFEQSQVLDATDYLNRHMAGVTIKSPGDIQAFSPFTAV